MRILEFVFCSALLVGALATPYSTFENVESEENKIDEMDNFLGIPEETGNDEIIPYPTSRPSTIYPTFRPTRPTTTTTTPEPTTSTTTPEPTTSTTTPEPTTTSTTTTTTTTTSTTVPPSTTTTRRPRPTRPPRPTTTFRPRPPRPTTLRPRPTTTARPRPATGNPQIYRNAVRSLGPFAGRLTNVVLNKRGVQKTNQSNRIRYNLRFANAIRRLLEDEKF